MRRNPGLDVSKSPLAVPAKTREPADGISRRRLARRRRGSAPGGDRRWLAPPLSSFGFRCLKFLDVSSLEPERSDRRLLSGARSAAPAAGPAVGTAPLRRPGGRDAGHAGFAARDLRRGRPGAGRPPAPTASTRPRSCATSTTARPAAWPAAASCANGRSSPRTARSKSRPGSSTRPGPTTAASPARPCAPARASGCGSASSTPPNIRTRCTSTASTRR